MPKSTVTETVENIVEDITPTESKTAKLKNIVTNPKFIATAVVITVAGVVIAMNSRKTENETTEG